MTAKAHKRAVAKRATPKRAKAPKREKAIIHRRRRTASPSAKKVTLMLTAEEYKTIEEFSYITGASIPDILRQSFHEKAGIEPPLTAVEARELRAKSKEKLTS
jgi:hypothetical protein